MKTTSNIRSILPTVFACHRPIRAIVVIRAEAILTAAAALMVTCAAHSQGLIAILNRNGSSTTAAPGQVYAPVYREDPNDPTHRISGSTPNGIPPGNTSYNGAPFIDGNQGISFVVTLWGRISTNVTGTAEGNNLEPLENGITTFRTNAPASFGGIWRPTDNNLSPLPGAVTDAHRGTFQIRVWDTRGGTIKTWDEVMLAENNNVLRGYSDLFTVPWPLGGTEFPPNPAPYLQGLESFNVFIVPEPSVVVLSLLGLAGGLWFLRHRK